MNADDVWVPPSGIVALVRIMYPNGIPVERFELAMKRIEEYSQIVIDTGTDEERARLGEMLDCIRAAWAPLLPGGSE